MRKPVADRRSVRSGRAAVVGSAILCEGVGDDRIGMAVAHPVLRHRLITSFSAEADGVRSDDLIDQLLDRLGPDGDEGGAASQLDAVMR